jgi:hypothetical protein
MKQITLLELIIVIVFLTLFVGLGYCVYKITDMKYQALVIGKLSENETWRNELTMFLNYNVQNGKLILPNKTPQMQPLPPDWKPPKIEGGKK